MEQESKCGGDNPVHVSARGICSDRGASAVEYGILLGAVAASIAVVIYVLGQSIVAGLTNLDGLLP